jgi:hypothetical protein
MNERRIRCDDYLGSCDVYCISHYWRFLLLIYFEAVILDVKLVLNTYDTE